MKKYIVRTSDGVCIYVGNPENKPGLTAPDYVIITTFRPSEFHIWNFVDEEWQLSQAKIDAYKREKIKIECNRLLNILFCYSCYQHDCQLLIDLGQQITLPYTEAQMLEILQYKQALRAFPDDPNTDLDNPVYPTKPNFI